MSKPVGNPPLTIRDKAAAAEKRVGPDAGKDSKGHIKPKLTIRPSGNPFKKKIGVKAEVKY